MDFVFGQVVYVIYSCILNVKKFIYQLSCI